jgi:hypothetical protein
VRDINPAGERKRGKAGRWENLEGNRGHREIGRNRGQVFNLDNSATMS